MSDNNTSQNEEVDLGQLFELIGNMFSNFFNFIGSIFKGLFHILLLVLIHFYKGIKWYIAAVVIGVVVGYILDKNSDDVYGANLFIETNFNSSRQVYENIKHLHQLAHVDKDTVELASRLGLTVHEAASIKGFTIEPDIEEAKIVQQFSKFKEQLDSVSRSEANYEVFKENLSVFSYKSHRIGVLSTDKFIYKKLSTKIVEEITENEYLKELQKVAGENLIDEKISLNKQSTEIDILTKEYLKIRLNESKKEPIPGAGTNLFLGGEAGQSNLLVNESALVQKKYELDMEIRRVNKDFVIRQNIVNVISDFPSSGYDVSEWTSKKKFVLPVLLFSITFLGSILLLLSKYLAEQDELLKGSKG